MAQGSGSVLPRVPVERTPEGFRLLPRAPRLQISAPAVAVGIGWLGFAFLLALTFYAGEGNVMAALFVGIGILAMGSLALPVIRRFSRRSDGHLVLDRWPLRLGEEVRARFTARGQRGVAAVVGTLRCYEEVMFGLHSRHQLNVAIRHEETLEESSWRADGETVSDEWTFRIPPSRPPSFSVRWNKVLWELSVVVESGGVDRESSFPLVVLPEVVE